MYNNVTITLVDEYQEDRIYAIKTPGEGTQLVRVRPAPNAGAINYEIDYLTPSGWHLLAIGDREDPPVPIDYNAAIKRAVTILELER